MSLQTIKSSLPDYAKDIKLNLSRLLLDEQENAGLSPSQVYGIALASSYTVSNQLAAAVIETAGDQLSEAHVRAAKSAASIMAMNNIYYRFIHEVSDQDYQNMPAGLRMNVIANPGIDKIDFELMSLAVSAINGCGMCMNAHATQVNHAGLSKQSIQTTIKIASVMNALGQVEKIGL